MTYDEKCHNFLNVAKNIAQMSTCQFTKVGCLIVTPEFKPVSFGYNGTISGACHCGSISMSRDEHLKFSDEREIHAEMNAILQADRDKLKGSIVFTTITPCANCLKHLAAAGVGKVYSGGVYWRYNQNDLMNLGLKAESFGIQLFIESEDGSDFYTP